MSSYSQSASNTYTETRAKYVLGKIYDDFCAIDTRNFDQFEKKPGKLLSWKEDLYFIMQHEDLSSFQIQFTHGNPTKNLAIHYDIKADGSIQTDSNSGGVNYWNFPKDTIIGLVVEMPKKQIVLDHLKKRNWGMNGKFVEGNEEKAGAYSKDGYGANRKKIGKWED